MSRRRGDELTADQDMESQFCHFFLLVNQGTYT